MIMTTITINGTEVKIWPRTIDGHAWQEIGNLASLPFVFRHIALMPDAHGGKGMPIGGVLATKDVVIPNAVGVDIGCGMGAVKTSLKVEDITQEVLRKQILRGVRKRIPIGMGRHQAAQDEVLMPQGHDIESMTVVKRQYQAALKQIGSLGGGNHFIELQRDEDGYLWVMLHSGSRNLGKQVYDYYNEKAGELNRRWHSAVAPAMMLSFLPLHAPEFDRYWVEMQYCTGFALANRHLMMERIKEVISDVFPDIRFERMINIAHNYAAFEDHFGERVIVHRKGAVRAALGDIGIIPGSQGTASYIVEGLGNPDSFMSSSHGAGRRMSRSEAVAKLSMADEVAMLERQGIVHAIRGRHDLEEAAGAYKDIDEVMVQQADLVVIKTKLMPIAVIKG